MLALLGLFVFRVTAQLVQRFAPIPILPPFAAWQSGTVPYPVLVTAQFAIIVASIWFTRCLWQATINPDRRTGLILAWIGGIYFSGSLLRFIAGFTFARQNAFLSAHLPGFFHMVLAAMVLTAAHFYLLQRRVETA